MIKIEMSPISYQLKSQTETIHRTIFPFITCNYGLCLIVHFANVKGYTHMAQQKESTSAQLRDELETLADTLEEILHSSGDKPKAELDKLRSKAENLLKNTRTRLSDTSEKIVDQTKEIADRADNYVHEKPWTGVGIGAAVGLVLGVLLTRR